MADQGTSTATSRWSGDAGGMGRDVQQLTFYMHSNSPAARFVASHVLAKAHLSAPSSEAHAKDAQRDVQWTEWTLGCNADRGLREHCSEQLPTASECKALQDGTADTSASKRVLEDDLLVPGNRGRSSVLASMPQLQYASQKALYRTLLLRHVSLFWIRRRGRFPFRQQRVLSDEQDDEEATEREGDERHTQQEEVVRALSYGHRVQQRSLRVMVNHMASELFLTQKGMLVRCLCEAYGADGYLDIHPKTALFLLDKAPPYNNRAFRRLHCAKLTVYNLKSVTLDPYCTAEGHGDDELLWIIKPAIGSCGRGIQILDLTHARTSLQALARRRQQVEANGEAEAEREKRLAQVAKEEKAETEAVYARLRGIIDEYRDESGTELVVQKYVKQPLLYRGFKFDLRVYVLLASAARPFVALYTTEGYLRVCSDLYQGSGYSNRNAHVTNFHVQREHPLYDKATDSIQGQTTRVSYDQLLDYLQEVDYRVKDVEESDATCHYGQQHRWMPAALRAMADDGVTEEEMEAKCQESATLARAWTEWRMHKQIRHVVGKAVEAARPGIMADDDTCIGQFALLGVDLLLEEDGGMWLIEFTKSPAFRFEPQYLADMHSRVLGDAMDIAMEVEHLRSCLPSPTDHVPVEAINALRNSASWALLPNVRPA